MSTAKLYGRLMDSARDLQKEISTLKSLGLPGGDKLREAQGLVLGVAWTIRPSRRK